MLSVDAQLLSGPASGQWWAAMQRWSAGFLITVVWLSGCIFAAYIVTFFGGAALRGEAESWNLAIPGLFDMRSVLATIGIGFHFAAGGVLLLLGPVQFMGRLRQKLPGVHRWLGRLYLGSACVAGLGGLGFIVDRGTIGGQVMDVGFGLYGLLIVGCAAMVFHHARTGRHDLHGAWATRLFALTIGSWLYRIEYSLWYVWLDFIGEPAIRGSWFDAAMAFMFYVPNLVIAELLIRTRRTQTGVLFNVATTALNVTAGLFVLLATWFQASMWVPGMARGLGYA